MIVKLFIVIKVMLYEIRNGSIWRPRFILKRIPCIKCARGGFLRSYPYGWSRKNVNYKGPTKSHPGLNETPVFDVVKFGPNYSLLPRPLDFTSTLLHKLLEGKKTNTACVLLLRFLN